MSSLDVPRNGPGAIAYIEGLGNDWALSAMTALELISGAKNQREVELIDCLIEVYSAIPVSDAIGRRAYDLLRKYARPSGLKTFDSLIAATALDEQRTLVSRNRKHFGMIDGLKLEIPVY